jgi:hypothetical protein
MWAVRRAGCGRASSRLGERGRTDHKGQGDGDETEGGFHFLNRFWFFRARGDSCGARDVLFDSNAAPRADASGTKPGKNVANQACQGAVVQPQVGLANGGLGSCDGHAALNLAGISNGAPLPRVAWGERDTPNTRFLFSPSASAARRGLSGASWIRLRERHANLVEPIFENRGELPADSIGAESFCGAFNQSFI